MGRVSCWGNGGGSWDGFESFESKESGYVVRACERCHLWHLMSLHQLARCIEAELSSWDALISWSSYCGRDSGRRGLIVKSSHQTHIQDTAKLLGHSNIAMTQR